MPAIAIDELIHEKITARLFRINQLTLPAETPTQLLRTHATSIIADARLYLSVLPAMTFSGRRDRLRTFARLTTTL